MIFDPSSIAIFSVILVPIPINGGHETKRMVVIGHSENHAICLKATSKVDFYKNSQFKDVVFYSAGEYSFFEKDTAIQPNNQFAISHENLENYHKNGSFKILDQLPSTFKSSLIVAIGNSHTMNSKKSKRLMSLLGCH